MVWWPGPLIITLALLGSMIPLFIESSGPVGALDRSELRMRWLRIPLVITTCVFGAITIVMIVFWI